MAEPPFLVCIVDDDASVRASLTRLLVEHGYPVETFDSGPAFLERSPCTDPCRLLIDVSMPEMNGIEVVRRLQRAGQTARVVFMSARDDDATRRRIAQVGRIELLHKPFVADEVIAALVRAQPLTPSREAE